MAKLPAKPSDVFDRATEWKNLAAFVTDQAAEMRLGVVWGRRRQGKSFVLQALTEATRGFYYEAFAGTSVELLNDLGSKLAHYLGVGAPLRLATWDDALDALASLGDDRTTTVVLDEFPFLAAAAPSLPSLIARVLSPRGAQRRRSRVRLILCGSALRFMIALLGGSAPLRGRAGLEQVIGAFDHRLARTYWGIDDPRLALLTFAVVGGTPAYKREFLRDDVPRSVRDFDAWVCRTALEPASSLFREGRVLVEEEPNISDTALYHSVLAAIASGEHKPSAIASRVGRPLSALPHAFGVLEGVGLVERHVDAFRSNRTEYEITEPIVSFHHAIMRPSWANLERGRAQSTWAAAKPTFYAKLVGPTFERICREWARAQYGHVGRGTVADPAAKTSHEIDVVALEGKRVHLLGEAKWSEPLTARTSTRLEHVRALLEERGYDVSQCRLVGFTGTTRKSARASTLEIVDLERLYA